MNYLQDLNYPIQGTPLLVLPENKEISNMHNDIIFTASVQNIYLEEKRGAGKFTYFRLVKRCISECVCVFFFSIVEVYI